MIDDDFYKMNVETKENDQSRKLEKIDLLRVKLKKAREEAYIDNCNKEAKLKKDKAEANKLRRSDRKQNVENNTNNRKRRASEITNKSVTGPICKKKCRSEPATKSVKKSVDRDIPKQQSVAETRNTGNKSMRENTCKRQPATKTDSTRNKSVTRITQKKKTNVTASMLEKAEAAKRHNANERKKKQRLKISKDPELQKSYREKERNTYKKRKEEGRIKSITQMNKRQQGKQPKKWRMNSLKYLKIRKESMESQVVIDDAVDTSASASEQLTLNVSMQRSIGYKKARAYRVSLNRKCSRLEQELKKAKALHEKWKKKYNRVVLPGKGSPSPRKVVERVLRQGKNAI